MVDEVIAARQAQHWAHLMNAARRHAGNRSERMHVVGLPFSYGGHSGWHYVIMGAASAARSRAGRAR